MLDYSVLLYDPVYAEIGVEAQFAAGGSTVPLTVIDDTRPKILPAGSAEVRSVGPGAFVRIPELERNGISRDDWMDASLSFNGRSWVVRSYELRGSPNGEDLGEVRFLLKAVESSNGGGGATTPDWVPANAKIHIDFLGGTPQGRAWSNGAEVVIDTLLGSDPNTLNAWGPTSYDSARLNAYGYDSSSGANDFAFIGAALSKILAGCTIRFGYTIPVVNEGGLAFYIVAANGNDAVYFEIRASPNSFVVGSYSGPASATLTGAINSGGNGVNGIAITVTQTRGEFAANGSLATAAVFNTVDWPTSNPLVAALVSPGGSDPAALQSITIYDPLPDTTGLSELSAVGDG
jgi:hypothetical protein